MYEWVYLDGSRGVVGLYLPHDPDGTRVERPIPPGEASYVPPAELLLDMLSEAARRSIGG